MKLTLEEAVELHRKFWNYIAHHMDEYFDYIGDVERNNNIALTYNRIRQWKKDVISKIGGKEPVLNHCFLCEYTNNISKDSKTFEDDTCYFCPLVQDLDKSCLDGLYNTFLDHLYYKRFYLAVDTAFKIRDLPIVNRKGEQYELSKKLGYKEENT